MWSLRRCVPIIIALLLCTTAREAGGVTPKQACDYRDALCALRSRFGFGSFSIGDTVYYSGGLNADDPTYPMGGSYLEAFDAHTLSPFVLQTQPDVALNTSRYRQQMSVWGTDKVVMVGGQFDDKNGASQKTMSLVILDLNTRMWKLRRDFWQTNNADLIWNWARVYGDSLFMVLEDFGGEDPDTGKDRDMTLMGRSMYVFNLTEPRKGKDLQAVYDVLPGGILFLQLPVVAGTVTQDGVVVVWQSARRVAAPDALADAEFELPAAMPVVIDPSDKETAVRPIFQLSLDAGGFQRPKTSAGGTGGKILNAAMTSRGGGVQLYLWSVAAATFEGRPGPRSVQVLTQYTIKPDAPAGGAPASAQITLDRVFVAAPPGSRIGQLRTVDLPMASVVAVTPADLAAGRVVEMPYVGEVDLVDDLDRSNIDIQETESGLFIRGNSLPDDSCLKSTNSSEVEVKRWTPFVIAIDNDAGGAPPPPPKGAAAAALRPVAVRAQGANTWCAKSDLVEYLYGIQEANWKTKGFRGMHGVAGPGAAGGRQLMVLSPRMEKTMGVFASYIKEGPLSGAFVDVGGKSISKFAVTPAKGYQFPRYVGACVTKLPGSPREVYLEYGGSASSGRPKDDIISDVSTMIVPSEDPRRGSEISASALGLPPRVEPAVACGPDGRAWAFGGLADLNTDPENTVWGPTADLSAIRLRGAAAAVEAAPVKRAAGAKWPAARYGAGLAFLPLEVTGQREGSLLLFGGSNGTDPELSNKYVRSANRSTLMNDLWLFDVSAGSWAPLAASGEPPPPMMWHALAADGAGALLYGGATFDDETQAWGRDDNLYVLEFPPGGGGGVPMWRRAPVGGQGRGAALRTEFINTAVVPLGGIVALQREKELTVTSKPSSADLAGGAAGAVAAGGAGGVAARFAKITASMSSGDWVSLSALGDVIVLDEPLVVAGDYVITGGAAPQPGGTGTAGRRLAGAGAAAGGVTVKCGKNNPTAFNIMSAGVVLRDLTITGCSGGAVRLLPDPSQEPNGGRYPDGYPVQLHNVTLRGNPGPALVLENGTAAALHGCLVSGNGGGNKSGAAGSAAPGGAVVAAAGTLLGLTDCDLVDNHGPAVSFSGVQLNATNCRFLGNEAADGAGIFSRFLEPDPALYASSGAGGAAAEVPSLGRLRISRCAFRGNVASGGGGGMFVGPRMTAFVTRSAFTGNNATEGGGAHADRDGCLQLLTDTEFSGNWAATYGGGLLSRAPLCEDSSMAWERVTAVNNTAGGDGGGAYVSEAASRRLVITGGNFEANSALGEYPLGRSGDGGALYLGTWSSEVVLNATRISGNRAARSGGGVHAIMMSQDSRPDLILIGCEAALNSALVPGALDGNAATEGGALRVLGSFATVQITRSTFDRNGAGQGGAVSFGADRGNVSVGGGTTFSRNRAAVAGGGLLAGESVNVRLDGAAFINNTAAPHTEGDYFGPSAGPSALRPPVRNVGAGGGFVCYRCNSAVISNCSFDGNAARLYGGGAAVLQPHSGASLASSVFRGNSAAAAPPRVELRRRSLLQAAPATVEPTLILPYLGGVAPAADPGAAPPAAAPTAPPASAAQAAPRAGARPAALTLIVPVLPLDAPQAPVQACSDDGECVNGGFRLGAWATTVDVTNTTADDGLYGGGGGLYLSIRGPINMSGCEFTGNKAQNGGGMIARTDLCPDFPPSASTACKLRLVGRSNSFVDNAADTGAGGGLLFTKLGSDRVLLPDCGPGGLTEASFQACLGDAAGAGASSSRRSLLGAEAAGGGIGVEPLNSVSALGYGYDVASTARTAHFVKLDDVDMTDGGPGGGGGAGGVAPVSTDFWSSPSGRVPVTLRLRDELLRDVRGNISDASMLMQAVLQYPNGTVADDITLLGNISRGFNGVVDFSTLAVNADPGTYTVLFVPMDPGNRVLLPANLTLHLRECMAGEAQESLQGEAAAADPYRQKRRSVTCSECKFGSYSLDPRVGYCVQCDRETNANCTGVALVPDDGFWQSHPRSPLVHRCLVDQACRKGANKYRMHAFAKRYRAFSIEELGRPVNGTGSPLFQEYVDLQCSPGYEGTLCGQCSPGYGHRGYRCVACDGRRGVNSLLYALAALYLMALIALAGFMHVKQVERKRRSVAAETQLSFLLSVGINGADGGAGGRETAAPGWRPPPVERLPAASEVWGPPPPERALSGGHLGAGLGGWGGVGSVLPPQLTDRSLGGLDSNFSWDQRSPFEDGSRQEASGALKDNPPLAPTMSGGPFAAAKAKRGGTSAPSAAAGAPAPLGGSGQAKSASWLQGLFSVESLREPPPTLTALPSNVGAAADAAAAAVVAANGGAAVAAGAPAAPVVQAPPKRFWVSSVLKLFITHLQLLGLLRGLHINWPEGVGAALVFFDQTSTVSTWVSLDCSMGDDTGDAGEVRRSFKRTLLMLMLPVFGIALALLFWAAHAAVSACVVSRRLNVRRLTWRTHYKGRVILTVVLVLFYLYPQVSNAVVSIFSCTMLDASTPVSRFRQHALDADRELSHLSGAMVADAPRGYWNQDTHYQCMTGHHSALVGLGAVWVVAFCLGFPAVMVAALWRHKGRLNETETDLRYGFFYDSYDPKYYYWESVILVEKLLLVVAITLLQRYNATAQVLVALVVVSLAAVLQATFRPSGCGMLHTLQRSSWYVLQCTLFLLMLSSIEDFTSKEVAAAALAVATFLNVVLVGMFVYALFAESRRLLLWCVGKGPGDSLEWVDVWAFVRGTLGGGWGGSGAGGDAARLSRSGSRSQDKPPLKGRLGDKKQQRQRWLKVRRGPVADDAEDEGEEGEEQEDDTREQQQHKGGRMSGEGRHKAAAAKGADQV